MDSKLVSLAVLVAKTIIRGTLKVVAAGAHCERKIPLRNRLTMRKHCRLSYSGICVSALRHGPKSGSETSTEMSVQTVV